jgi:acyl-CoA synthetase (AMP-forming)/AMP-acid ligase II
MLDMHHVDTELSQYFRDPEATRKAFRGGWFNSGDLAVMHPDGTVAILDRSKDIIISGGEVCDSYAAGTLIHSLMAERVESRYRAGSVLSVRRSSARQLMSQAELATHPDVFEVSVVARTHPHWGERAMAFVILHPAAKDKWVTRSDDFEKHLKAHARTRLPGFACPEWVEIVDELPKTSTGKIQKMMLRKLAAKL